MNESLATTVHRIKTKLTLSIESVRFLRRYFAVSTSPFAQNSLASSTFQS